MLALDQLSQEQEAVEMLAGFKRRKDDSHQKISLAFTDSIRCCLVVYPDFVDLGSTIQHPGAGSIAVSLCAYRERHEYQDSAYGRQDESNNHRDET